MSCYTCKHFKQQTEDHGFCEYPMPAWLIIALWKIDITDKAKMPRRYSPCACHEEKEDVWIKQN